MPKNICQTPKIKIPKGLSKSDRDSIGNDIIQYIIDRTQSGKGADGKKYPGADANKYSKSYGKKGTVDLTDSGEMLFDALQITVNNKEEIAVGVPLGSQAWGKAKGNILGSYGRSPNPNKARNFLDIGESDMRKISKIIERYARDADVTEDAIKMALETRLAN